MPSPTKPSTAINFCPSCGLPAQGAANFCFNCGLNLKVIRLSLGISARVQEPEVVTIFPKGKAWKPKKAYKKGPRKVVTEELSKEIIHRYFELRQSFQQIAEATGMIPGSISSHVFRKKRQLGLTRKKPEQKDAV